jgi:hypothetical protein
MVVFAIIVLNIALGLLRGASPTALPAVAIGVGYVLFGTTAIALLHSSLPLISFVVVGALLLVFAAWPFTKSVS